MSFDDECAARAHGLFLHFFVHEASHAVFAIDSGIDFLHLRVEALAAFPAGVLPGEAVAPAHVDMGTSNPADWVLPNQEAALDFLIAGTFGEKAILGHRVDRGFAGDMAVYATATSSLALSDDQRRTQVADSHARVEGRWTELEPRVRVLAHAVYERADADRHHPTVLTRDEIVALLES